MRPHIGGHNANAAGLCVVCNYEPLTLCFSIGKLCPSVFMRLYQTDRARRINQASDNSFQTESGFKDTDNNDIEELNRKQPHLKRSRAARREHLEISVMDLRPAPALETIPGGVSKSQPADQKIQDMCNSLKGEVEKRTGMNYHTFRALSYRDQVVAGMNYYVEVHVGGKNCLELQIYDRFGPLSLINVKQYEKTEPQESSESVSQGSVKDNTPLAQKIVGGRGESRPADQKVQDMCDSLKGEVEKKTGMNYHTFQAKSYKTQVVAGLNYFVEVHVGGKNYLELQIYDRFGQPSLTNVKQYEKTEPQVNNVTFYAAFTC
ncbi:hypothetical protein WMY93_020059 [Mugilogobius chulae]|uniref:Cystatin-B n=1 Tax=Mugilogobius chulae TaxID=88201 RepID=A0AAW0NG91_9GOBI